MGHTLNLGYIPKNGQLWTDATGWAGGDTQLFQSYINDLAQHFCGEVTKRNTDVGYVTINGKAPHIETLTDRFDDWLTVIDRFQDRIRNNINEGIRDE